MTSTYSVNRAALLVLILTDMLWMTLRLISFYDVVSLTSFIFFLLTGFAHAGGFFAIQKEKYYLIMVYIVIHTFLTILHFFTPEMPNNLDYSLLIVVLGSVMLYFLNN